MLLGDHVTLKPCCTDSGLNPIHRAKTTLKSGAKNVGMPLISGQAGKYLRLSEPGLSQYNLPYFSHLHSMHRAGLEPATQ